MDDPLDQEEARILREVADLDRALEREEQRRLEFEAKHALMKQVRRATYSKIEALRYERQRSKLLTKEADDEDLSARIGVAIPEWNHIAQLLHLTGRAWGTAREQMGPYSAYWSHDANKVLLVEHSHGRSRLVGVWWFEGWTRPPFVPESQVSELARVCRDVFEELSDDPPWRDQNMLYRASNACADDAVWSRIKGALPRLFAAPSSERIGIVRALLAEEGEKECVAAWCVRCKHDGRWVEVPFISRSLALDYAVDIKESASAVSVVFRAAGKWRKLRAAGPTIGWGFPDGSSFWRLAIDQHGRAGRLDGWPEPRYLYAIPRLPSELCY